MIPVKIVFVVCVLFGTVSPSAIPMWEYLTQDEKVMYLYNMFQTQVQDFCETNICKQDLRNYGWNKLKTMGEDHLDKMDPFQRDSNSIIWESVMDGHEMMKTTEKPKTSSQNSNDEDMYSEDAEATIDTFSKIAPPKEFSNYPQFTITVGKPEYKIPEQQYTDTIYTSSNKIQESTTEGAIPVIDTFGEYQRIPLTGPMVVKVLPDGTPIKGEKQILPEDEDLKQYQLTKTVFQNL